MKPTPKDSDIEQLTLTEFLLARIAEDEEVARATTGGDRTGNWWLDPDEGGVTEVSCLDVQGFVYAVDVDAAHIARHDPASVLAECEAKRRIVEYATNQHTSGPDWDLAVGFLAAVYADHPDYREEWKP